MPFNLNAIKLNGWENYGVSDKWNKKNRKREEKKNTELSNFKIDSFSWMLFFDRKCIMAFDEDKKKIKKI